MFFIDPSNHRSPVSFSQCSEFFGGVEKCPNGDYVVGRHAPETDGSMVIYDSQGYYLYSEGGLCYDGCSHRSSPIAVFRRIIHQTIGCEESESINTCHKSENEF